MVMKVYNQSKGAKKTFKFNGGMKKFFCKMEKKLFILILIIVPFLHGAEKKLDLLLAKGSQCVEISGSLKVFVEALNELISKEFSSVDILRLFQENPIDLHDLDPYVFLEEKKYTRNLIKKCGEYELILMCWAPGQKSRIHGHENQICCLRVESGQLEFTNYTDLEEDGVTRRKQLFQYPVEIGDKGTIAGPAYIHEVANCTSAPAISLHLYAKPFHQCDVFDLASNIRERINLTFYSINGKRV